MTRDKPLDTLAPDIDPHWREDFVLELRLRGASGAAIADALAEAQTHIRHSGQSALTAFGPAVDYAQALDLPDESGWTAAGLLRIWTQLLLLVGGTTLGLNGVLALLLTEDHRAEISAGWLISLGGALLAMVLVFVLGEHLVRFLIDHMVWSAVLFGATVAGVVAVGIPFQDIILGSVPALGPLVAGLVALTGWGLLTLLWRRSGTSLDDPLTPPEPDNGAPY